jgi:GT2 family glycosyltransferase
VGIRVIDWELDEPLRDRPLDGCTRAAVYVRLGGVPLGRVLLDNLDGHSLTPQQVVEAIERDEPTMLTVCRALARRKLLGMTPEQPARSNTLPASWSVVICTRDRSEDVDRCLAALTRHELAGGEVLVVDNAPSDERTREVVGRYPGVRYVLEPRAGLNRARHRGAVEARGEVVLYADDDTVPDPAWTRHMVARFDRPRIGAVTGMTLPLELETRAQQLFELRYGGLGRGYAPRVWDRSTLDPTASIRAGAGANMAIRRGLILELGLFDVELDCGTVARTGGDAYAFYRLLAEGYCIAYHPPAVLWHKHRRTEPELTRALTGYTVGGMAFLVRLVLDHGEWSAIRTFFRWVRSDHLKQVARSVRRRENRLPPRMILAQWSAIPGGIIAGWRSFRLDRRRRASAATGGVEPNPSRGRGEATESPRCSSDAGARSAA